MTRDSSGFLQGPAWAKFKKHISCEVLKKSSATWSYSGFVESGQLSKRLYCPLGPIAKDKKPLKLALDSLRHEAKKRHLDFVRVEPALDGLTAEDLKKMGLKHAHRDEQPPHTVVNDVSKSIDDIEKELSQTARRYARKCDKAGITYSVSYEPTDIKYFIEMIHDVSERTGMKPHDDLHFQQIASTLFPDKSAGLLFAELNGTRIASIIFYSDGTTMSYAHAANFTKYRKYSPAIGLGLYALKFAHDQGCRWFDWYGVAPANDDGNPRWKSWKGFTQFKLSYGGERVDRLGTWELPINKRRYLIYRLALRVAHR